MKKKAKDNDNLFTPEEFSGVMQWLDMVDQLTKAKGQLRYLLNQKSNEEIRANLKEYEEHHTIDGTPVSEETYKVLTAELIHRGPYGSLLNRKNRTNQKIL